MLGYSLWSPQQRVGRGREKSAGETSWNIMQTKKVGLLMRHAQHSASCEILTIIQDTWLMAIIIITKF